MCVRGGCVVWVYVLHIYIYLCSVFMSSDWLNLVGKRSSCLVDEET